MLQRPRLPHPEQRFGDDDDGDDWPVDRGRPLALRWLALVGALAFVMLGLSSLQPLLQPAPQPLPGPRDAAVS
ncbi:hypothetical protein [Cyanobium sp. ULC084]|nr:hypothetical protein [Synechococcus sp. CS-1327]